MKKVLVIIGFLTVVSLGFISYNKAHNIRECKVIQEYDKWVTVLHPNGEVYDFFTDNTNLYKKDTIIKVSFNELKLSKKDYTVNSVK